MNLQETAAVLAKAAAYDNRNVGEANVRAWHEALGDLALADCLAAVAQHHRTSTDYLMPAHIRRLVEEARPPLTEVLAELRERPECIHGEPGGGELHPSSGLPLCPFCRHALRRGLTAEEAS
jgi:hypothetical protein